MKSKFVLTEEESKRILTLHKEKIDQKRTIVSEEVTENTNVIEEQNKWWTDPNNNTVKKTVRNGVLTLFKDITLEKATGMGLRNELKLFKGAEFKIVQPGSLISDTRYSFVSSLDGYETYNPKKGKIGYNCKSGKFRVLGGGSEDRYFNENYAIESAGFKYMCYLSLKQGGTPTPSKKGCPSIVKSFTDAGYTQITVERYKELANDTTRIRNYRYCPVTKKNLYFAKPKATQTGPAPTPTPVKGGGGQTYPFDYETILKAFPPDEIINPFEQGGEEEVQSSIVTDKIYAEF